MMDERTKVTCGVIRDLLPLYVEGIAGKDSAALVEAHLAGCPACRAAREQLAAPAPAIAARRTEAESFARSLRKARRGIGWRAALIAAAAVVGIFVLRLAATGMLVGFLALDVLTAKVEVDDDPAHYAQYMGADALEPYRDKWGMDETIFPASLDGLDVTAYRMVYYDPWDKQFASYLTVQYDEAGYAAETARLAAYPSTDYVGYYSVTPFPEGTLLAMEADSYQGFVYAIATPDTPQSVTYVELIFCNEAFDIDYRDYIPLPYLPPSFEALPKNR